MAEFHRTERGIGYLSVNYEEMQAYSQLPFLVCDNCNAGLSPADSITVIPILNMAYCENCAIARLPAILDYPEDREIRTRREEFWANFYKLSTK